MFECDCRKLELSFNEFHSMDAADLLPEYGEFCLLELKDGRYTAGKWSPDNYGEVKTASGDFIRGTADTVASEEVLRWHSLDRYDLSECLKDKDITFINLGAGEDEDSVVFGEFRSLTEGDLPGSEQYCLLLLTNGDLAAGRWDELGSGDGSFIYAPALASYDMDEVWAWTALSADDIFTLEEERIREGELEEELNRHPSADPELFRYGTDIEVYYEKALEKLREKYPWATVTQMKKPKPWEIVPLHGQYVFGRTEESYYGKAVDAWEGSSADEFIDFLCGYAEESVRNSDPGEKFRFGLDIDAYLEKAYENVRKDYRWLDKKTAAEPWRYDIKQVGGDWEFVRKYKGSKDWDVCSCGSAERFIEIVEHGYQEAALRANPAVAEYAVPFGHVELHGWYLEKYVFSKLRTGDYKVYVQAGDRTTGGGREFFITPHCFEADTYEEFLDRYLEIVPGGSFGMNKEDLLQNDELKEFLGY